MICNIYNPFLFRFNNIFIPFNQFCCFFRILYLFCFLKFKSSNSRFSSMIIKSSNRFFISSLDLRFVFLLSTELFHFYKQKINTLVPNLKQKYLSKLIFCKFRSKKIPHLQSSLLFHILLLILHYLGNVYLTAFKTAETIFTCFLSILITRACYSRLARQKNAWSSLAFFYLRRVVSYR